MTTAAARPRSLAHHHDFRQLWAGDAVVGAPFAALKPLASALPSVPTLVAGSFGLFFTVGRLQHHPGQLPAAACAPGPCSAG